MCIQIELWERDLGIEQNNIKLRNCLEHLLWRRDWLQCSESKTRHWPVVARSASDVINTCVMIMLCSLASDNWYQHILYRNRVSVSPTSQAGNNIKMFAATLIAVSIVNQIQRDTTFIKQISNCSENFCLIVYFSEHLKFPHREFLMLQKLQIWRENITV